MCIRDSTMTPHSRRRHPTSSATELDGPRRSLVSHRGRPRSGAATRQEALLPSAPGGAMASSVHRLCVALISTLLLLPFAPTVAAADDPCSHQSYAPLSVKPGETPILFVHGIMSTSDMWKEQKPKPLLNQGQYIDSPAGYLQTEMSKPGAPEAASYTFDWSSKSGYDDGRNPPTLAWVTDQDLGLKLAHAISCLAEKSGRKVVVIAHSMGGLLAKYALGQSGVGSEVSDVFTIDTPFGGAYLANATNDPSTQTLLSALCPIPPIPLMHGFIGCQLWGLKDDAGTKGLRPDSDGLKQLPEWPGSVHVHEVVGEITYNLLWPVSANGKSIGDAVIDVKGQRLDAGSGSATGGKIVYPKTYTCSLPQLLDQRLDQVPADVMKGLDESGAGAVADAKAGAAIAVTFYSFLAARVGAIWNSPCFHINMPHNKEVLDDIISELATPNLMQWNPLTQNPSAGQNSQNPSAGQDAQNPSAGRNARNPSAGQQSLLPAAPTDVHVDQFYGVLRWTDNSNNENGFRVYQNGTLIGVENTNSTQFHGTAVGSCSDMIVVSAYNAAGESRSTPVSYCSSHY